MQCPQCYVVADEASKFCHACGTRIKPLPIVAARVVICDGTQDDGTLCGAELTAEKNFCSNCGQKVNVRLFKTSESDEKENSLTQKDEADERLVTVEPRGTRQTLPTKQTQETVETLQESGPLFEVKRKPTQTIPADSFIEKTVPTEPIVDRTEPDSPDITYKAEIEQERDTVEMLKPTSRNNSASKTDNIGLTDSVEIGYDKDTNEMLKRTSSIIYASKSDNIGLTDKIQIMQPDPELGEDNPGSSVLIKDEEVLRRQRGEKKQISESSVICQEQSSVDENNLNPDYDKSSQPSVPCFGNQNSQSLHAYETEEDIYSSDTNSEDCLFGTGEPTPKAPENQNQVNLSKHDCANENKTMPNMGKTPESKENKQNMKQHEKNVPHLQAKSKPSTFDVDLPNTQDNRKMATKDQDIYNDSDKHSDDECRTVKTPRDTVKIVKAYTSKDQGAHKKPDNGSRQRPRTDNKKVVVHFHVLLSEAFNLDRKPKQVILRSEHFGHGWDSMDKVLKVKKTWDTLTEFEIKVELPLSEVLGAKRLMYKYYITDSEKYKGEFEHYVQNGRQGAGVNRWLSIPNQWKDRDIWHQYDGVIERKPGTIGMIREYFKSTDVEKHARLSMESFSQSICESIKDEFTMQDGLDKFDMLITCFRRIYYLDNRCWDTESKFKREAGEALMTPIIQTVVTYQTLPQETDEQNEKMIALSLTAVFFVRNLEIDLPLDVADMLCRTLLPFVTNGESPTLKMHEKYFPNKSRELKDALVFFTKKMVAKGKDPSWLFIAPWIHFLSGACNPFDIPDVSDCQHDSRVPVWWGISHIGEDSVKIFKAHRADWRISLADVVNLLSPLFDLDYLLPRTLMAVVQLHQLSAVIEMGQLPVEVCLAALNYQLKVTRPKYADVSGYGNVSKDENMVLASAAALLKHLQTGLGSEKEIKGHFEMCYKIAATLLEESTETDRVVTMYTCAQLFVYCFAMYDRYVAMQKDQGGKEQYMAHVQEMTGVVHKWFKKYSGNWQENMDHYLKIWNNTLAANLPSDRVCDSWNMAILNMLPGTLKDEVCSSSYATEKFIRSFCENSGQYHQQMQDCLTEVAFEALSSDGYRVDYRSFTLHARKTFGGLLSDIFNLVWKKMMDSKGFREDQKMLIHVLNWQPFLHYLKIYEKDQQQQSLLTQECVHLIVLAVSDFEAKVQSLLKGSISVGTLNLIGQSSSRFTEVADLVCAEKKFSKYFIQNAIVIRKKEMEEFEKQATQMTSLTSLCQHLENVDREDVDEVLLKQSHRDKYMLDEFVRPAAIDQVDCVAAFRPDVCAFQVSDDVLDALPEITLCCQSSSFLNFWKHKCKEMGDQKMDLKDVLTNVWKPVKESWDKKAEEIITGTITFQGIEKVLGRLYQDDYENMKIEMRTMGLAENVSNTRIDQLREYRQLENCVKGARVILKFVKEYQLNGNFRDIETIAKHGQREMEMKSFDKNVVKTCGLLKHLGKEKAECLDMFIKSSPLVAWLKESMKSGLKELKVFVDLAFMSAGEEPLNISRVQCLHSAVTGYSPLIFDLKQTADFRMLLGKCEIVWKELEANPNLPIQLVDTSRQLEWLKEIKKAHGSVEVTSLVQADVINSTGIYTIGMAAWKTTTTSSSQGIANVVKLTVPEEEGKRQLRNYTFSELQDLHSRLMLVAGKAEKGSEGVETFTSVFDGVIRLTNVYLKLSAAGCALLKEWTARFFCLQKRDLCAILEFGQTEDVPKLKGLRNGNEDLKEFIPQIANFLEACYEDWLKYITAKRKEYLHLNFFTIDQLVILQRELVKCGTEDEPSHLVYPLLSAVKQDCTPEDLISAMTDAKAILDYKYDMDTDDGVEDTIEMTERELEDKQRNTFIQEIVNIGYSQELALIALEHVSSDNVDDGIVWCMDHCDDDDMEMAYGDEPHEKAGLSGWNQASDNSIQSVIAGKLKNISGTHRGKGAKPLLEDLEVLWKEFLGSISSNVKDYLSLEHLGLILQCLASKDTSAVDRIFPDSYIEGAPNLLICPSADVLPMVLSLYMMTRDQPLPLPDEVLMCTTQTTVDEVNIFWRRALFGDEKKIYCLVNADMLDYEVSDTAEKYLEEYLQAGASDKCYRLVVICGSDNEYRSRIVSSLDKHCRNTLPIILPQIRDYLTLKLQVKDQSRNPIPAAHVDFNKSTVRLIKSWRSGVGKTLYKERREADLAKLNSRHVHVESVSIPLQEKNIDLHRVMERLLEHTAVPGRIVPKIFHIDIAHEVQNGVDYLLFNLLVLGCVMDKTGYVWRKSSADIYLIETMPLMIQANAHKAVDVIYFHKMLSLLPDMTCRSPQESLDIYTKSGRQPKDHQASDQLFDEAQFSSPVFQRPFQYLFRHEQGRELKSIDPYTPERDPQTCLQTLLRHCGVHDPSWAELHHFVWFLNTQLHDFERSDFMSQAAAEDLPGFANFVLRFMIQMSRDFSTRSLNMSEESPVVKYEGEDVEDEEGEDLLQQFQMRRTWESSPHPYLFFNYDGHAFTFLGFYIEKATGNLVDQQTGQILEGAIMAQNLYDTLVHNKVPVQENFDALPRHKKIEKLCSVIGIETPHDPDDTYELTTDNVKKILAIFMRFRCDIPVIIMGETGCGKTRLIKFMCSLQMPPGLEVSNMVLMKVHGGTTNADIKRKVEEAEKLAIENVRTYGEQMYTVLFFDEANTTESIGLIKEIMCDKSMEGNKLKLCNNLKMVAACNPYRKHSDELINKLEQAGLGYHVRADKTSDRLGHVPMRRLVYRVQPLPQSLLPLVWDFGQLNTKVEDLYIRQMVRRHIREGKLPETPGMVEVISGILTASQDYMRDQNNECSFVSLRDVDRVLSVMSWFHMANSRNILYKAIDEKWKRDKESYIEESGDEDMEEQAPTLTTLDDITRSLVLALGVCYHACLRDRAQYRVRIARHFKVPCSLPEGADQFGKEILFCQEVFLDNVQLQKNIARNMALKENVFMMVVCIELRIPLFLVGKPGSSKSLAKTIVSDAMQGNSSRKALFKELMQAQMVSFQCSPLSTPDGIVGTFRQCAQFQKDKDLSSFVSIVVLDEVGLAEDSPRMPLKTLHPLLEDGCQGDEKPEKYKKVAFIGISNWALDPAKMNRGILVQREVPDLEELEDSARGICSSRRDVLARIEPLIEPLATSYLELFNKATQQKREFYGLRDFYSLVKMVYAFAEKSKQKPTWHEMYHAIKRNFGGLDQVDPITNFEKNLATVMTLHQKQKPTDPDITPTGLIQACLFDTNEMKSESRYLLLLTENYGALAILQQEILASDIRPITIFGSSFRCDQEYTQICRNINKIKVCMETGNTVVLLNLENLYESLYDALNQYYVYFGGERYIDLGLGTHRVKCPVHKNFRLIVVAEKQTVYDQFPIPLINRLEKHFLTLSNMLSQEQQKLVEKLESWAGNFVKQKNYAQQSKRAQKQQSTKTCDVFMGFHDDTCPSIVLHVWKTFVNDRGEEDTEKIARASKETPLWCATPDTVIRLDKCSLPTIEVFQASKEMLLWCATPDAVVRLDKCSLPAIEAHAMKNVYFRQQAHDNIAQYLNQKLVIELCDKLFAQVTTHSKLLASFHRQELSQAARLPVSQITLLDTLSSFDTEQQFSNKIKQHLKQCGGDTSLLLVQCDSGDVNANLVACARYCVMDEIENFRGELQAQVHVVFIVQLPNIAGGCFSGFQCGVWHSVHIDDMWSTDSKMPTVLDMQGKSVATLFQTAIETDDPQVIRTPGDEDRNWKRTELIPREDSVRNTYFEIEKPVPSTSTAVKFTQDRLPLPLDDVASRKSLNLRGLVLSCVQAALSMVKDKQENTVRTTDRVRLVLKLFHQKSGGEQSFLQGVCKLIASLLKDKEMLTHGGYMATHWLVNEAAKSENIHKAGTFRRACIQTLEAKIVPILAGIIAFLDTNENLGLLQDVASNSSDVVKEAVLAWKQNFWLKVLNTKSTIPLKVSDLQSPNRQSDLPEVIVMTTGCDGQMFACQMPFSWLIHQQLTSVLKSPMPRSEDEGDLGMTEKVEFFVGVMSECQLGKALTGLRDDEVMNEVVMDYISDFVQMICKIVSVEEHQLICRSVAYNVSQMAEGSLLHILVAVHFAYTALEPRLVYFHQMNCVWPQCSKTIIRMKEENPDHVMFREKEFTFSALCLLIENLTPVKDSLNNHELRTEWLKMVNQYRQVVEKVISLHKEDPRKYGAHSEALVKRARGLWARVVVVKLFLEHVCEAGDKDKITIKICMPLWKILGEEADFKEIKSLEAVEKILKICNKTARKVYLGKDEECCNCGNVLDGPPVVLPCKDVICDNCLHVLRTLGEKACPKCKKEVDETWNPERQIKNPESVEKMRGYQKRCNSFFMDIVSQLCFADNTQPSAEVIEKLIKYVLCSDSSVRSGVRMTKEMSIFDIGIDPNPVFRSFLLQLLMRVSREEASANLELYLGQATGFIQEDDVEREQHYTQLCLLVIQCFEDMLLQESLSTDLGDAVQGNEYLRHAVDFIDNADLSVNRLCAIAEARVGLAITAKYVAQIVNPTQKATQQDKRVRRLIGGAHSLCEDVKSKWPRIYLIKYLCRCYGVEAYRKVCKSEELYLHWIIADLDQRIEGPDRYVVNGVLYTNIRESLTRVVLGEEVQQLLDTLQGIAAAHGHVEVMLQLAVHREITSSFLYPAQQRKVTQKIVETLEETVVTSDLVKNKGLMTALLHNEHRLDQQRVTERDELRHQGIQCLVQHFISVVSELKGDRTLMQPLLTLVRNPETCRDFYLPTMPQDDLECLREEMKKAMEAARQGNVKFYRCPNGHLYGIGDCGRAVVVAKCPTCKADIGGSGHTLLETNRADTRFDQTSQTGHILGRAEMRGRGPRPERDLNKVCCACLRLLTHLAMYIGTVSNIQGIRALIKPGIDINGVEAFLWQHILMDIEEMQRGVGRSVDDVLLLLHTVLDNVMKNHSQADVGLEDGHIILRTKQGRAEWERRFSASYLQATLQNIGNVLARSNHLVTQDHRLGADPLLCLLYETETQQEAVNPGMLQDMPAVWRYRTPISVDHLHQEFDAQIVSMPQKKQMFEVLQLFLKEDHNLRAIRHIPAILKLQHMLFNKYQRRLDKAEANAITIERMKKDMDTDVSELVASFADAWELVRDDLKQYMCPTDLGGMVVSKEYCNKSITDDLPVAILLPTMREIGLCSHALLDFLMRKQNNFLDKYITATKRRHITMTTVAPRDVTPAHLISYDPQQDVLPLVLANCKYSFEMGKGTNIEYDFEGLEKQLMDRFLFSKSRINVGRALQIEHMVYRAEITDAIVFEKLAEKIPQEGLNAAVKSQISSEFKSLPDLCTSLDNLDITISFLTSVGGDPQQSLDEFMVSTLKMENSLTSQKARQECQFRYAKSLWLLLSLLKVKEIADHNQTRESMFESVAADFHDDLPDPVLQMFMDYAKPLSIDNLSRFVEILHECIVLKIAVKENPDDEDYQDSRDNGLCDYLSAYLDAMEQRPLDVGVLTDFPPDILLRHCTHTWTEAYRLLVEKKSGNRPY